MEREANLPVLPELAPSDTAGTDLSLSISHSQSSALSSPPDFLRQVQAAFKRHRPLGAIKSNNIMPKRSVCLPHQDASRNVASDLGPSADVKKTDDVLPPSHYITGKDSDDKVKNSVRVVGESREDSSITQPSVSCTITKALDESFNLYSSQGDQPEPAIGCRELHLESHQAGFQKKVQFSVANDNSTQEMEWDTSSQGGSSAVINHDSKHQNFQNIDSDISLRSDGAVSSLLAKRTMVLQEQLHQFRDFLGQPITQSSVVGSQCATTTSVHSTSAPTYNSTTSCSHSHQDGASRVAMEPLRVSNKNSQLLTQKDTIQHSSISLRDSSVVPADQRTHGAQAPAPAFDSQTEDKEYDVPREKQGTLAKAHDVSDGPSPQKKKSSGGEISGDIIDVQSQAPLSKSSFADTNSESLKTDKSAKKGKTVNNRGGAVSHKKNYDPDLFFKVNGKLYQRLGKIGSGGSSEVHKVISSDCRIYALKRIKLKGRDYATAYGFCQEIEYLTRLKGKNHIIQLIDYEVTDKALLKEVLSGSASNKDGRVRDDECVYMVLEYGEIDLAHMLSQKWKEIECSDQTIDENWLRFYWQQILLAVNTIHEERIVHSDLKPANFLLVKGSLKLIDFGIAKAIMSDTTNIQRDSQVGTLSYMSPEAFMCNETDADGNIIKCGRPSDIWSLGCILYQMVYGRTPFADYKTFWAKFKVITDPNHEITYEPVSNPWLVDLMKKCLAWDRNERWRIPQLLQHPFLNPPFSSPRLESYGQSCKLLQRLAEACSDNENASMLRFKLRELLMNPNPSMSRDQQCELLSRVSKVCLQLQEWIENSG